MSQMYQQYERQRVDNIADPDVRRQHPISIISGTSHVTEKKNSLSYGSFTLPDTNTYSNTDKMCTEPMEICISLDLGPL